MITSKPIITECLPAIKQNTHSLQLLKRGVWAYILLLIFEGALRKWILPSLATPLLVVRDPIALWILLMAMYRNILPFNIFAFSMIFIAIVSFFTTLLLGHGSISVALYGARILLIHFPLMFAIGRIFDKDDVIKVGKFILYLTPLMALLIAVQFYSPQSAFVNKGIGSDENGAGFRGALNYFRPPATFSFTNGTTLFFSFVAPFVFYFWLNRNNIKKLLLIAATVGLLVAIPLSISRSLLFSVSVTFLFLIFASFYQPRYLSATVYAAVGALIAFAVLLNTSFFQTGIEAFTARFESANKVEGGLEGVIGERYFGGMIGALTNRSDKLPIFGYGLGMGTNAGAMMLTGKADFLISEGEWGRLVGEMGPILGVLAILTRVCFSAQVTISAFRYLSKAYLLPWLLLSFALLTVPQSQWAQPTSLGFSTLIGGLLLASLNTKK
ncbi:MAG TPA: hypothetical protein VGN63_01800 [Flavisolibacter sp.]|jgi:hypothetical protein|nr:hypothetical protein [Flavisolibacter sp.]